jgi:serine protease Do
VINTQADGIGFAIPIDVAKRIASELIEHGEILPVWLGLDFQELDPALQEVMDLPDGVFGPLVNAVDPKGPAALGGLRRGDVVLEMDGHPIPRARDFFRHLKTVVVGQEIGLGVWRNGSKVGVNILADEIPREQIDDLAKRLLGVRLEPDPKGGFVIAQVVRGGPAARRGFEPSDILLAINGRTLQSRGDLRRALVDLRGRQAAYLVVLRDGRRYPVTLELL